MNHLNHPAKTKKGWKKTNKTKQNPTKNQETNLQKKTSPKNFWKKKENYTPVKLT